MVPFPLELVPSFSSGSFLWCFSCVVVCFLFFGVVCSFLLWCVFLVLYFFFLPYFVGFQLFGLIVAQEGQNIKTKEQNQDNPKTLTSNQPAKQKFGLLVVWLFCCPKKWHRYVYCLRKWQRYGLRIWYL